jgi:hypothetical protein
MSTSTTPAAGVVAFAARHLSTLRAVLALTLLAVVAVVAASVALPRRAEKVSWVQTAAETTAAGVGGRLPGPAAGLPAWTPGFDPSTTGREAGR